MVITTTINLTREDVADAVVAFLYDKGWVANRESFTTAASFAGCTITAMKGENGASSATYIVGAQDLRWGKRYFIRASGPPLTTDEARLALKFHCVEAETLRDTLFCSAREGRLGSDYDSETLFFTQRAEM